MKIINRTRKPTDKKAEKTPRRVKVFLPIGAKLPGGYEPIVFIRDRKSADGKGGAK